VALGSGRVTGEVAAARTTGARDMADDDDEIRNGADTETDEEDELETDADLEEGPDAEDLEDEDSFEELDDEDSVEEAEEEEEEEGDEDESATTRAKRRAGEEEEDEDDELLSPDDVEADLDRILKDRLVTSDEDEDEDEEEDEPEDRADGGNRLQPKRADEQLCPQCFLLVRASAPVCPVGDDACPIFS
jgi:hypothetical protein